MNTMNKILIGIGIIILILTTTIVSIFNGLVSSEESVNAKWANVQSAYQRRADLIPNLVTVVKQYSNYEGTILTDITNARASVGKATNPTELDAAGKDLDSAISRLLVIVENYPNLKANENYLSLQDELAGTENRIKTERDIYNEAVKQYNIKVRSFPTNMIASNFGFTQKTMFESKTGADVAPNVETLIQ